MPYPPTARQQQLLRFIAAYMAEHGGVAPTLGEMSAAIGCKGKPAAQRLLTRMAERGLIRRRRHHERAIEIIARPQPVSRAPDGAPLYFISAPHRTAEEQPAGSLAGSVATAPRPHFASSDHTAIFT